MRALVPAVVCRLALLGLLLAARPAGGQEVIERGGDLADRPISTIQIAGGGESDDQLVRNNLRAAVGEPYDTETVRGDVNRIYRLGRFKFVTAEVELLADGTVELLYSVTRQPTIKEIQTVGNKAASDQELRGSIGIVRGLARDEFLIEKAKADIKKVYRKKGFYLTEVSIDESRLESSGLLIFRIIEGPRVRIKAIEFRGAAAYSEKRLLAEIKTRTHVFLFRAGVLDEDVLLGDDVSLDKYYKDRGYIDVRVGHMIELSPDNAEAKVIFLIDEGREYTLRGVRAEAAGGGPLTVFTSEQIAALLEIKSGDVYSTDRVTKARQTLIQAYWALGHIDVEERSVIVLEERVGTEPVVDLRLVVEEGRPYKVGLVRISGNFLTKDKVIRRLVTLAPGRSLDGNKLADTERRIRENRLFGEVRVTPQEPDEVDPDQRDLLIEVKEKNTGSFNFGIAVGSDEGVFGDFSLTQQNFDIADPPVDFQEWASGRSFRGAGQRFSMVLRPGNEIFLYSISLTEPYFLESPYSLSGAFAYSAREYDEYDENRLSASAGLTRALGEIWSIHWSARYERVKLTDIDFDAPADVFADQGPDSFPSLGVTLERTTIGTIRRPGRGSRLSLTLDKVGVVGEDVDFWRVDSSYTLFLTLNEDFLGRKSILRLRTRAGYIFGDGRAPTYERFYMGGRNFRGFEYRTISPKGLTRTGQQTDDPVGGSWLFFTGAQYDVPLFGEMVTGVLFVDSGTVTDDVGFDEYRVSIGCGIRLHIPALGPVPIAFDFGFPILEGEGDETQTLSFSAELPFG